MNKANESKQLNIEVNNELYERIPIKTHVIMPHEEWAPIFDKYVVPEINSDDIVFIAESVVAVFQGRVAKVVDIKPRKLANFLSTKVSHNPGGIGLTCPEMMEMAFREAGTLRMLAAAVASVIGKVLRKNGWFYIVAGAAVRDIDGPDEYTIPPYNEYVVLAPSNPNKVANEMSAYLGCQVTIVDINDLGQNVLGNSAGWANEKLIAKILSDNPLGQSDEQTPIGIIRKRN